MKRLNGEFGIKMDRCIRFVCKLDLTDPVQKNNYKHINEIAFNMRIGSVSGVYTFWRNIQTQLQLIDEENQS